MDINLEKFPTSPSAIRMLSYVTNGWYDKSYVGKWIYQVIGSEIDDTKNIVDGLKYQIFAETATWGIIYHEMKYGIPFDSSKDIDERRKAVIAKRDHINRTPWTPYFVESIVWKNFSLKSRLVDHSRKFSSTLELMIGEKDSINSPSKILGYIRKIKPSHIDIDLLCAIEAAVVVSEEIFSLWEMLISVNVIEHNYCQIPEMGIKIESRSNESQTFTGKVMYYKALNRWNGEHKFDGSIKFNTEIREDELDMKAEMTHTGKVKLLRARAGEISMPKITGFAFGTGGVNETGVIQPVGNTLKAEFLRKNIDNYVLEAESERVKYYCTLSGSEAAGKVISEIGLYDADGDIIMVSNFLGKGKDDGLTMRFEIDDVV